MQHNVMWKKLTSHVKIMERPVECVDKTRAQVQSILGTTKDAEYLQSFVRANGDDEEETPPPKPSISKRAPPGSEKVKEVRLDEDQKISGSRKDGSKPKKTGRRRRRSARRRREEEVYTDKDRAAAVVMGSKDIKQSLSMKDKADKSSILHLPVEVDAGNLLGLARAEITRERYRVAMSFVEKAIELAPEEKAAYVARSKCYLLLGEPRAALADAERALQLDPKSTQALLNKAEALYYCGEFEMSLVHYHRGLRMRPDLQAFRLGIQKAQEAIENTIGAVNPTKKTTKKRDTKAARPAPSQLKSDKEYLEKLLKSPELCVADRKNETVARCAEEALRFLENRAEFWRQQQTNGGH